MTALQMRQKRAFDERKGIREEYRFTPIFIIVTAVLTVFVGFQYVAAKQYEGNAKELYYVQAEV